MEAPRGPEKLTQTPYRVFIAGIFGEGKNLTSLRDAFSQKYRSDAKVYSSVSGKFALKEGDSNLKDRYHTMAHEVATEAHTRDLWLDGHSLGGDEIIRLANALLDAGEWNGKKLDLNFIGVPGFGERGIRGLVNLAKNSQEAFGNFGRYEQHTAYPLFDSYYGRNALREVAEGKATTAFTDNPEERGERRARFEKQLETMIPNPQERQKKLDEIHTLDQQIASAFEQGLPTDRLVAQRGTLLQPLIDQLFYGNQFSPETHDTYLKQYAELPDQAKSSLKVMAQAFLHFGKNIMFGMDRQVRKLQEKAKLRGVEVGLNFTFMERDLLVSPDQIDKVRRRLSDQEVSALPTIFYLQQLAHSTIGYASEKITAVPAS